MAKRCCLLHLIKQNCLLKTFLRTPILMTRVSLYLFYYKIFIQDGRFSIYIFTKYIELLLSKRVLSKRKEISGRNYWKFQAETRMIYKGAMIYNSLTRDICMQENENLLQVSLITILILV